MENDNVEPDEAIDDFITYIEDEIVHRELKPYEAEAIEGKVLYWWAAVQKLCKQ